MTESVERPDPPLSNSVESNERLEVHQANPMECTGRRGTPPSDTIGDNERVVGLPISDEIIEINHLKAPLARPSIEHSHYPALKGIDIKAETGYSSYADYVEAYCANRPYLERVLLFIGAGENVASKYGITILDLVKEGSSLPRVVWRCQSQSARNILMTLRQPPAYAALQIVLWNATDYLIPNLVNKLGLGLKIDPRFFEALDEESRRRRHWDPKHVTINGAVATVIRHYNTEEVDVAPIVFIAGMQWESESMIAAEEDIGGTLPFQHPAARTYPFHSPPYDRVGYFPGQYEHPNYIRLLEWYFEKDKDLPSSGTDLMLQPLIPLFYLSIFRIREFCKSVRHEYDIIHKEDRATAWWANTRENIISGLPKKRLRLRAMVEDSEDALDHFLRYIGSQHSADYLSTQSWLKAEGDIKRTHQEAARLEAQIRDYLQIQVGEWALQESRRSIEVSNRQIEEGKRG